MLNSSYSLNIVLWHVSHIWIHTAHYWLSHWIEWTSATLSSASSFVLAVWLFATLIRSRLATHRLTTLTSLKSSLLLHKHWHALNEKLKVVLELFLVG